MIYYCMKLHTKQKGNIGELRIAADLAQRGFYVFTELGDICKSDLLIMDETYRPIKVQVKSRKSKNSTVFLESRKSGPNYRFRYETKHVDVYAIFVPDRDLILYVPASVFETQLTFTLRLEWAKTNQSKNVNWYEYYLDFPQL